MLAGVPQEIGKVAEIENLLGNRTEALLQTEKEVMIERVSQRKDLREMGKFVHLFYK
jgi:hypothetical protein